MSWPAGKGDRRSEKKAVERNGGAEGVSTEQREVEKKVHWELHFRIRNCALALRVSAWLGATRFRSFDSL